MTIRPRNQIVIQGTVAGGATDQQLSAILPVSEVWHLERVIFAHGLDNRNYSGGFRLEWGSGATWEFITGAYLTGNTMIIPIKQDYTGDGSKRFRLTRQNLDPTAAKNMHVVIDGFKKL